MDGLRLRLANLFARKKHLHIVALVAKPSQVPDELPTNAAILTGPSLNSPRWILFDCPCRRGHRVMLNLSGAERPVWRYKGLRKLSLQPSVDDLTLDRCHYFVRNGLIEWV